MTKKEILEITRKYQENLEELNGTPPYGTCHLAGYSLAAVFNERGYNSRSVTGHLMVLDKNEKKILYSSKDPTYRRNVGYYHTWCEIVMDGQIYIVDPSFKYNIPFLRKNYRIKVHPKIPPILVTKERHTYYWMYVEDNKLLPLSDAEMNKVDPNITDKLIDGLKQF